MKKGYRFLAVLALAGIAAVPLSACDFVNGGNDGADHKTEATEIGTYSGITSTESIYGIGAVTTAQLLSESMNPTAPMPSDPVTPTPGETTPGETTPEQPAEPAPEQPADPTPSDPSQQPDYGLPEGNAPQIGEVQDAAKDFNTYFNMLDSFLDKAATKTVVEENTSTDPMLAEYALKLTITGKNALGEDDVHIIYYTETVSDAQELQNGRPRRNARDFDDDDDDDDDDRYDYDDDDDDDDRYDHDYDDDDDEVKTVTATTYTLKGVVLMGQDEAGNDVYYFMTGSRTERTFTEIDGREEESKSTSTLEMTAYASELDLQNDQNYVTLSHTSTTESETEHNDTETESKSLYTYSVYRGGKLAESTQVEFETEEEHGEVEAEYTVTFLSGASRGTYEIERETKGTSTWISVKYNIDGNRGKFVIVENADGTYTYKFSQSKADDRTMANF